MSKNNTGEKPKIRKDKPRDMDPFEIKRKKNNGTNAKSKKLKEWEQLANDYYSQYGS
jgi:hypothetical protein